MTELKRLHEMEWFADRVKASCYHISEHVIRSLMAKKLGITDIENILFSGSVLEEHHHEQRGTSYLVCGLSNGRPIHLCVADGKNNWLIIVFAYIPSPPVWKTPKSRNRSGETTMSEKMRSCYFCGGEIKEITVGNFDYRLEGQLYVIKKVPAGLCQQCGEKYVETEVAQKMNALIDEEKFSGTEKVRVIEYNQTGAQ